MSNRRTALFAVIAALTILITPVAASAETSAIATPETKADQALERFLCQLTSDTDLETLDPAGQTVERIDPCLPECHTQFDCQFICAPCEPPIFNTGICENEGSCFAHCECFCGRN